MSSSDWTGVIPLVLLVALAYLLLIRPARRRAHEIQSVQSALSTGDEVMLTSGIFGIVTTVTDDRLRLELADGVEVWVARAAVAKIIRDVPAGPVGSEDEAAPADATDDGGVADASDEGAPADSTDEGHPQDRGES